MEPTQQGSLPFLDTLVTIEPNNTFSTTVYRKPTHTDQYLHWHSNHHITAKQSVFNTLAHRAKVVSSSQDTLDKELQHIKTALQWEHRFLSSNQSNNNSNNNNQDTNPTKRNITLVVPFIPGTSQKFKRLCKVKGIQVHYRGTNTHRTQLVKPKDKDPKTQKGGIIYHYKCPHINCPDAYIGESGRALGDRVKEHLKAPSPIFQHSTTTGHALDSHNFNIIHKEVPGPSKKPCSYASMTQPSTGTWENINYRIYGTTYCRHHLPYSSSLLAFQPPPLLPLSNPPQPYPSNSQPLIQAGGMCF